MKPHLFELLERIDERGLTNHVLVITRWRVDPADCARLNTLRHLRLTLLLTHSGIEDDRIEPVDSSIAATSLHTAFEHADRYRVVLYWRPIVPGLNDTDTHLAHALDLSRHAHATVYTGLFYRDQIRDQYRANGLPEPYDDVARRKVFPQLLEQRILTAAARRSAGSPLFRKTSCAVSHEHGTADYNGHYGIRELCDICPVAQIVRCSRAWTAPDPRTVAELTTDLGGTLTTITDRAILVQGLDDQRRYLMQHTLGFQAGPTCPRTA
ncbi:radical SAM protein [Saccharothrix australiensis]|uniref:Radical SAM protein n=1 Tax=Saccharothrix australiensis TaxID=2072 RepID=A0A495W1A9_9PSEU|nr:radical SAM protein [Saccharothrix australiensis]RKT55406.1 hypothetical protein C8E97_4074 [Saccharothrix australiensis]